MMATLNARYRAAKRNIRENQFIGESTMDVEDVLPGSEEEMNDVTDVESVPAEAYKKVDKYLDQIVSDPNYDDTEAEELLGDDELDEGEVSDDDLNAVLDEACECPGWEDNEDMGHPEKKRHDDEIHQDKFEDPCQEGL